MDGMLVVNKPRGITSHDVVDIVRRRFNIRKVGHAGTLDPMAVGVLVLLIGRATKLSAKLLNEDKGYIATLYLGKSTDTQDSTGKTIEEKPIDGLSIEAIKKAFASFLGETEQVPPMISAKKYKGKRLYELARKGRSVSRKPNRIRIYEIEPLDIKLPEIVFRIKCSKGTYIRTLCESIGKFLGYPAHMSGLVRVSQGRFSLKDAHELDEINENDIQTVES